MSKAKVLIADDEPEILDVMVRKVALEGYEVFDAKDGQEAWEKIQKENPDVIVLDITMPHKGGLEVLRDLRKNPSSLKWQPVILVSAHRDLEDLKKGFALEADHYIGKPCRVEDIIKAIKLMLSLAPKRDVL